MKGDTEFEEFWSERCYLAGKGRRRPRMLKDLIRLAYFKGRFDATKETPSINNCIAAACRIVELQEKIERSVGGARAE